MDEPNAKYIARSNVSDEEKRIFIEKIYRSGISLDLLTPDERRLFLTRTRELCGLEDPLAMEIMAGMLNGGREECPCDYEGAWRLMLRLYEMGRDDAPLNYALGRMYLTGRFRAGAPDFEKAFFHLSVAAAAGFRPASVQLSDMYLNGLHVRKNPAAAAALLLGIYRHDIENVKENHLSGCLGETAMRLGDMERDVLRSGCPRPNNDAAAVYYLQARFAQRHNAAIYGKNAETEAGNEIERRLADVLPETSFPVPADSVCGADVSRFFSSVPSHRRMEMTVTANADETFHASVRILPMYSEQYTPRLFLTVPEARFCGLADKAGLTLTAEDKGLILNGKPLCGKTAVVIFDGFIGNTLTLYGKPVLQGIRRSTLDMSSLSAQQPLLFVIAVMQGGHRHVIYRCGFKNVRPGDTVIIPIVKSEAPARVIHVFRLPDHEMEHSVSEYAAVLRIADRPIQDG